MNRISKAKGGIQVLLAVIALCFTQLALAGPITTGDEIVIGNEAVDREHSDTWSNFVLNLTTEIFPIYGSVTEWSVYAATSGTMGLLIMDNGVVTASDIVKVTEGLNTFTFVPDTGTHLVAPGFNVGLWLGSATVDFSRGDTEGDTVQWCASNGCAVAPPSAGDFLEFTGSGLNTFRQYSVSVVDPPWPAANDVAVPEPGSLALLGLGLAMFGFSRRGKKAA